MGVPGCAVVKNLPASAGDAGDAGLIPGSGRCPVVGNGNKPTPIFLLGKFHGQRSLAGVYSPSGRKKSDMTEHTCTPLPTSQLNFQSQYTYTGITPYGRTRF